MKRAFEGDDIDLLGVALLEPVLADHLHREFAGLGAGIGEEDGIGESGGDERLGKRRLAGDFVEIGGVPELLRLFGQHLDEHGIGMAERVDRDAGGGPNGRCIFLVIGYGER